MSWNLRSRNTRNPRCTIHRTGSGPATTNISLPTFSGISIVNLANKTGNITADFSNTGVSLVTVQNATAIGDAITLKSGQVAGLDNVKVTAAAGAATNETFAFGNTSTSASLALANGTNISGTNNNVALTGTSIATINVQSAGTTANTVASLTNNGTANFRTDKAGKYRVKLPARDGIWYWQVSVRGDSRYRGNSYIWQTEVFHRR